MRHGLRHFVALNEGPQGTVGILTTNQSKEIMTVAVQELITHNRLHIFKDMVSVSCSRDEILLQLYQEMRRFMILVEPPKTLFGKPRRTYSGKMGGQNDDVVITLQLAVLGMQMFYNDHENKYSAWHVR